MDGSGDGVERGRRTTASGGARVQVEELRAFLVAVEEPSLRKAAVRLHLSQPALSERIARLERSLGVRLLDRDATGSRPTADGLRLLPYVRDAVEQLDRVALVASHRAPPSVVRPRVVAGMLVDGVEELTWPVLSEVRSWPGRPDVVVTAVAVRACVDVVLARRAGVVLARGPFTDRRVRVTTLAWTAVGVLLPAFPPLAGVSGTVPPSVPLRRPLQALTALDSPLGDALAATAWEVARHLVPLSPRLSATACDDLGASALHTAPTARGPGRSPGRVTGRRSRATSRHAR